jgi:hypothetical protein
MFLHETKVLTDATAGISSLNPLLPDTEPVITIATRNPLNTVQHQLVADNNPSTTSTFTYSYSSKHTVYS